MIKVVYKVDDFIHLQLCAHNTCNTCIQYTQAYYFIIISTRQQQSIQMYSNTHKLYNFATLILPNNHIIINLFFLLVHNRHINIFYLSINVHTIINQIYASIAIKGLIIANKKTLYCNFDKRIIQRCYNNSKYKQCSHNNRLERILDCEKLSTVFEIIWYNITFKLLQKLISTLKKYQRNLRSSFQRRFQKQESFVSALASLHGTFFGFLERNQKK
eukprot:TRINITY_DN29521_c0_g2_i1.p1 TRINITY_DN29521_c0_g2~~TRINITY_DN29521_c0_g2_i1.p1  ORF type:complete len:234 (+),score=-14.55 TRINITY_DN29521_c0_g2_i1:55-702(+)